MENTVYLIDYENVSYKGLYGISEVKPEDEIIIFYSNDISIIQDIISSYVKQGITIKYFELDKTGKNALDFMVSAYAGYAASKAALILSVCMGVLAVCKIFFGMLLDKLGIRRVTYLGIVVMVMTFVVSIFARYTVMMLLIFPLMGFACSYITVGIPYLVRKVFGAREYAAFFGVVSALENLGSSVIPTVSGMVYDAMSSYVPLFVAAIIFVSFSGMLYTYVFRWVSREKRQAAAAGQNG